MHLLASVLLMGVFPALSAESVRCVEAGQIRRLVNGRRVIEKTAYCFNYDRTYLVSRDCAAPRAHCKAVDTSHAGDGIRAIAKKDKFPGRTVCEKVGGEAQAIEFISDGVWYDLDRCFFSADGSYMDTSHFFVRQKNVFKSRKSD